MIINRNLDDTWQITKIKHIAHVIMGQAPPGTSYNQEGQGIPLIAGASDLGTYYPHSTRWTTSPSQLCQSGDLIYGIRATIGDINWADREYCLGRGVAAIRANSKLVDPSYLYYWLIVSKDVLTKLATGSTFIQIRRQDIEDLSIPLPPLPEQRRIVAILQQADKLRQMRRLADEKIEQLLPALFYEMFGDPTTNPKGWKKVTLSSVGQLDRGRSQHRPRDAAHLYDGPYPFIQTGDVANSDGIITQYTQTYSEAGLAQSRLWPKHTLCITIAANIAKTAILTFDACFPDSIVGFIPGPQVTVEYVRQWFVAIQNALETFAPQAAQKNINLQILRNLQIPLPPLKLQEIFTRFVAEIREIIKKQHMGRKSLEILFQSLISQAFTGELTAAWREKHPEVSKETQLFSGLFDKEEQKIAFTAEYAFNEDLAVTSEAVFARSMPRPEVTTTLSREQCNLLEVINGLKGYFTMSMVQPNSGMSPHVIREGLQLFTSLGLIQEIRLPDRPMRNVVMYVPAYRNINEQDRAKERDLELLEKASRAAIQGFDPLEKEIFP